jgi:hypothetical protein
MVAASASALLWGGTRRTLRAPRVVSSVLLALGVLLLANTRPYEGLLVSLVPAWLLARWLWRSRRCPLSRKVRRFIVPATLVVVAGAAGMGLYNRAVTGDAGTTPYGLQMRQYFAHGAFLFSPPHEPQRAPGARIAEFYRQYESPPVHGMELVGAAARNAGPRLFASLGTPFGLMYGRHAVHFLGALLWLALLVGAAVLRSRLAFLGSAVLAALVECLLWCGAPAYLPILTGTLMAAFVLAFTATCRGNRWAGAIVVTVASVALGQALTRWWWPHYAAPLVPLLLLAVASSIQRLAGRFAASAGPHRPVRILAPLLAVQAMAIAVLAVLFPIGDARPGAAPLRSRADVEHRLRAQPGQHLVFVRYLDGYTVDLEWVYNPADLPSAPVIFAHDLGDARNPDLISEFPDRTPWITEVSPQEIRLGPYPPGPGG